MNIASGPTFVLQLIPNSYFRISNPTVRMAADGEVEEFVVERVMDKRVGRNGKVNKFVNSDLALALVILQNCD